MFCYPAEQESRQTLLNRTSYIPDCMLAATTDWCWKSNAAFESTGQSRNLVLVVTGNDMRHWFTEAFEVQCHLELVKGSFFNSCVSRHFVENANKSPVLNQGSTSVEKNTAPSMTETPAPVLEYSKLQNQTVKFVNSASVLCPINRREKAPMRCFDGSLSRPCGISPAPETLDRKDFRSRNTTSKLNAPVITLFNILLSMLKIVHWIGEVSTGISEQVVGWREPRKREKYLHRGIVENNSRDLYFLDELRRMFVATVLLLPLLMNVALLTPAEAAVDLRNRIISGAEPCFCFSAENNSFRMNCSTLHWKSQGYEFDTYITLGSNETFDGRPDTREEVIPVGQYQEWSYGIIDLSGVEDFEGLFKIEDAVAAFDEAPLIRNVHVRNGTLADESGFIVQKQERYFTIDSCSSTGSIPDKGGGICGYRSGYDNGKIKIINSHSTGNIIGKSAGGIAGANVADSGGIAHVLQSSSTGNIEGSRAGGICGARAGYWDGGRVYITQSYSTGDILSGASGSGGVVGSDAGASSGYVRIQECYSTGKISAEDSGGICGSYAASLEGELRIIDCYTRGSIDDQYAGGITGGKTGGYASMLPGTDTVFGDVYINNTYASGSVRDNEAGGMIGSTNVFFQGHTVHVQFSVYNDSEEGNIVGYDPSSVLTQTGNSENLDDIRGQLYHYGGIRQWDNNTWVVNGTHTLPILRFQLTRRSIGKASYYSGTPSPSPSMTASPSVIPFPTDLRESIINGTERCFQFISSKKLFRMICSALDWRGPWYGPDTHISLGVHETFDGSGCEKEANETCIIDLSGTEEFQGMFKINEEVKDFAEAPLIRNVHVKNGELALGGGFIVQKEQKYFMLDLCSSTGDIKQDEAGGVCGRKCGQQSGRIKILNSHSAGKITGLAAGGITGNEVGDDGGIVHITQCYSTGSITGQQAGGICGDKAGSLNGEVYIKQSYSTGDIETSADHSGSVVGNQAGADGGYVEIQECYSTGKFSADKSGGISGSHAADIGGEVHILDCYTRGDINGQYAGGIAGQYTGGCCSPTESAEYGKVYINNTYASGIVKREDAGGIIGGISSELQGRTIHVKYSVYNKKEEGQIIGKDLSSNLEETGNSNNLTDIRGQLYHYDGIQRWDNDTWVVSGDDSLPILRFQLPPTPTPTASSRSTRSPTMSSTASVTPTPSLSATECPKPTTTRTATSSTTVTPAASSRSTRSPTMSRTASVTPTPTTTRSATSSTTETVTRSSTSSSSSGTSSPDSSSSPRSSGSPTPKQSKSRQERLTTRRILPVQRPPRSVQQNPKQGKKRRKNKRD